MVGRVPGSAGDLFVLDPGELVVLLPQIGLDQLGRSEEAENGRVPFGETVTCEGCGGVGRQPADADRCSGRGSPDQERASVVPSAWVECCSMISSYGSAVEQRSTSSPPQAEVLSASVTDSTLVGSRRGITFQADSFGANFVGAGHGGLRSPRPMHECARGGCEILRRRCRRRTWRSSDPIRASEPGRRTRSRRFRPGCHIRCVKDLGFGVFEVSVTSLPHCYSTGIPSTNGGSRSMNC